MEEIKNVIEKVNQMEQKYDLTTDNISEIRENYEHFKVFVPLVGCFSAGKSALINNVLSQSWGNLEICMEDIDVKTAIPTEVYYGEEDAAFLCKNGQQTQIEIEEYMENRKKYTPDQIDVIRLQLCNEVLKEFPNVAIVDMPGLSSGNEVHDKIINAYIKKSLAYVLVFPADELAVKESMEGILYELNSFDMPICAVITKANRIIESGKTEEHIINDLKSQLTKYFPQKNIEIFLSEKENARVQEFIDYLVALDSRSEIIGKKSFAQRLQPEFARISNYLKGYLKDLDLSTSELDEKKDKLCKDMSDLSSDVNKQLSELESQMPQIVSAVSNDVQTALSERLDEFVEELTHDIDITNDINKTVQEALNKSIQNRVSYKIQKTLDKISSDISHVGSANYSATLKLDIDKICGKEINGVGRAAIDVIALMVVGPIGGILAHVITGFINRHNAEKRREEEQKVREQLAGGVFPRIDAEIRRQVEMNLNRTMLEIKTAVNSDLNLQMEVLQKSLDEVISKKKIEDENKNNKIAQIDHDLQEIESLQRQIVI